MRHDLKSSVDRSLPFPGSGSLTNSRNMIGCNRPGRTMLHRPINRTVRTMNDNREKLIRRAKPGYKSLEAADLVTRECERHGALMEALRQSEADEHVSREPVNKTEVEQ